MRGDGSYSVHYPAPGADSKGKVWGLCGRTGRITWTFEKNRVSCTLCEKKLLEQVKKKRDGQVLPAQLQQ